MRAINTYGEPNDTELIIRVLADHFTACLAPFYRFTVCLAGAGGGGRGQATGRLVARRAQRTSPLH